MSQKKLQDGPLADTRCVMVDVQPKYRELLRETLASRIEKNSRYSIRSFARSLQLDSGAFSQILSGNRIPSIKLARKLLDQLGYTPEERRVFLRSLAETHLARYPKRIKRGFEDILSEAQGTPTPATTYRELSLDHFRAIADWYHFAILELTFVKGFRPETKWISSALGISAAEANLAIIRLIELGYLEKTKNGMLVKSTLPLLTADRQLTSGAHKRRHRQILEKSTQALDEVPIEQRNHTAMTLAIDQKLVPEAKLRIQKFIDELSAFLESGKKERVYELVVNLFPLQTERKNP